MTNKFTIAFLGVILPMSCLAQATTEKKNIRIYEHHSSDINGGMPFGVGANGSQSGYDFVNHEYYNSFNPSTMGSWGTSEITNLDMVEHEGPYGGGGTTNPFGFTSGTSTIWGGEIKGNNLTVYAEAPSTFNYDLATDVSYIRAAFPEVSAEAIAEVEVGKVYLAKIRETEMYVAIKITDVENAPADLNPGVSIADVYFDFDYKYGTFDPTDIKGVYKNKNTFSIMPNPSKGSFTIVDFPANLDRSKARLDILDMTGRVIYARDATTNSIHQQFQPGNYLLLLSDGSNTYKSRLVVIE